MKIQKVKQRRPTEDRQIIGKNDLDPEMATTKQPESSFYQEKR
jgi:hypothetical protein